MSIKDAVSIELNPLTLKYTFHIKEEEPIVTCGLKKTRMRREEDVSYRDLEFSGRSLKESHVINDFRESLYPVGNEYALESVRCKKEQEVKKLKEAAYLGMKAVARELNRQEGERWNNLRIAEESDGLLANI